MSYSYWKLICKTLKVYSSSGLNGGLEMLSNLLDSTGIKRLVSIEVYLLYWKSIHNIFCKLLLGRFQNVH